MAKRLLLDSSTGYLRVRSAASHSGAFDITFKVGIISQYSTPAEGWQTPNFHFFADIDLGGNSGYQLQFGPQYTALFKAGSWIDGSADEPFILALGAESVIRIAYNAGTITFDVDGVNLITHTDPTPDSVGYFGFTGLESASYFDDITGTIVEDFESVTAGTYLSGEAIGANFVALDSVAVDGTDDANPAELAPVGRLLVIDNQTDITRLRTTVNYGPNIDQTFRMSVLAQYQEQVEGWHTGHFFASANDSLDGAVGYMFQMGPQWISVFRNNQWVAGTQANGFLFHLGVERLVRVQITNGRIVLTLDGVVAVDWTDPTPLAAGRIGLTSLNAKTHFDSFTGTINESFDLIEIKSYTTDEMVGPFLVRNATGTSIAEVTTSGGGGGGGSDPGTVDTPPPPDVYANSPYLPSFAQQIINPCVRFTNADGTTTKTVRTASENGDQIDNLIITSTDNSARVVEILISDGTTDRVLGQISVPANSGTAGTALNSGVDGMGYLDLPAFDEKAILLRPGYSLKARLLSALTSGDTLSIVGFGGAY